MEIKGWVLVSDLEGLGVVSNAIPVFIKNFLGEKNQDKLRRVVLYIEEEEYNSPHRAALPWEND